MAMPYNRCSLHIAPYGGVSNFHNRLEITIKPRPVNPQLITMFIDGMPGMERVLATDVNPPYLTLVTGPPGSMKSSFCLSLVSNHLRQSGGFGLYCTVEETTSSLLRASHSLGLTLPQNLQITDFTELRNENEDMDYLKFTQKMIEHFKRERGDAFSVFILDSLGAIYSCLLYTSPSPRDQRGSRMPSSA